MILKVKDFQNSCRKILEAVDTSSINVSADILELKVENNKLYLNVTNQEYYVSIISSVDTDEQLHAVISAKLFLELISRITTSELQMSIVNNYLLVEANGKYKFPLIYNDDKLVELQKISLGQVTNELNFSNETLQSILKYNSKELQKSGIKKIVQRMFYIDDLGAITFTSGACVNSFNLNQKIKLLLSEKIIKLFKLFNSENVKLTIGFDYVDNRLQNKIQFKNDEVELTTIMTSESSLIDSVPVNAIRTMASESLSNHVIVDRNQLTSTLNRLSLFSKDIVSILYTYLKFQRDSVIIYDTNKENYEILPYVSSSNNIDDYECILNLNDFKLTVESSSDSTMSIRFGNHRNIIVERDNIKNILPECVTM